MIETMEAVKTGWDTVDASPTPKQQKLLEKLKIDTGDIRSIQDANIAISTKLGTNRKETFIMKTIPLKLDNVDDAVININEIGEVTLTLRIFVKSKKGKIRDIKEVRLDWAELNKTIKQTKKGV